MDWMRNNGPSPVVDQSDSPSSPFDKVGSVPLSRRTPEERAKDVDNALNWLRNKGKNDDGNDPTGEFRRLDSILPKKKGQTPEDRARDIEGAMDWMRNAGVGVDENVPPGSPFEQVGSVPVSRRTPEERAKDLDNVLEWMRNKGKDDDKTDPTGDFRKLDSMLPKKPGQKPKDRARDIESAMDWMRNNGMSPVGDVSDSPSSPFEKLGSVPMSRRTPEERAKDVDDALNWLRNKGKDDEGTDPTGEFRRLDSMPIEEGSDTRGSCARH
jgi:broad-specificity NMP kinase